MQPICGGVLVAVLATGALRTRLRRARGRRAGLRTARISWATEALALLNSGPAGSLANTGHGAGDHRVGQAKVVCRIVVVDARIARRYR